MVLDVVVDGGVDISLCLLPELKLRLSRDKGTVARSWFLDVLCSAFRPSLKYQYVESL